MKTLIVFGIFFLAGIAVTHSQAYLGYTTSTVNFRSQPSSKGTLIASLKGGTALFVVSTEKQNGYYQVLNIETNKEGFVHSNYVQLQERLKENEEGIFTPTGKTSKSNPTVSIHNNTSKHLTLKLNDESYSFSPNQRREIVLKPGSYSYRASAPGVIPDFGSEYLQSNYDYEWSFYITSY